MSVDVTLNLVHVHYCSTGKALVYTFLKATNFWVVGSAFEVLGNIDLLRFNAALILHDKKA